MLEVFVHSRPWINYHQQTLAYYAERAVPWLRCLVSGLSPRRPRFASGSVHVGFVVDKVTLGQVFTPVLWFSYIIWGMNNRPVGGRSSETQSHPINVSKYKIERSHIDICGQVLKLFRLSIQMYKRVVVRLRCSTHDAQSLPLDLRLRVVILFHAG
jgi:hypothetical protein